MCFIILPSSEPCLKQHMPGFFHEQISFVKMHDIETSKNVVSQLYLLGLKNWHPNNNLWVKIYIAQINGPNNLLYYSTIIVLANRWHHSATDPCTGRGSITMRRTSHRPRYRDKTSNIERYKDGEEIRMEEKIYFF